MSNIHNEAKITDIEVVNVRRAAIEHRGKWAAAFYLEAKKDGIDLEPIMRRAVYNIGLQSGKEELEKLGGKVSAKSYGEYFCLKKYNETFEKHIEEVNGEDDFICSLNYCPLVHAWQKIGLDDETCHMLCDIAMEGDRGIAEGLGLDFDIEGTMSEGCEKCILHYRAKKQD